MRSEVRTKTPVSSGTVATQRAICAKWLVQKPLVRKTVVRRAVRMKLQVTGEGCHMVASFNVRAWADATPALARRVRVFVWRPLARSCYAGGSLKGAERVRRRGSVIEIRLCVIEKS